MNLGIKYLMATDTTQKKLNAGQKGPYCIFGSPYPPGTDIYAVRGDAPPPVPSVSPALGRTNITTARYSVGTGLLLCPPPAPSSNRAAMCRILPTSGAGRILPTSGAGRILLTSGAGRMLLTSGTGRILPSSGAGRMFLTSGADCCLLIAVGIARRATERGSETGDPRLQPATRSRTDPSSAGLSGPKLDAEVAGTGDGTDSVVRRLFALRVGERSEVRGFVAEDLVPALAVEPVEAALPAEAALVTEAELADIVLTPVTEVTVAVTAAVTAADRGLLRLSARRSGLVGGSSGEPHPGDGDLPELLARSLACPEEPPRNESALNRSLSSVRRSSLYRSIRCRTAAGAAAAEVLGVVTGVGSSVALEEMRGSLDLFDKVLTSCTDFERSERYSGRFRFSRSNEREMASHDPVLVWLERRSAPLNISLLSSLPTCSPAAASLSTSSHDVLRNECPLTPAILTSGATTV